MSAAALLIQLIAPFLVAASIRLAPPDDAFCYADPSTARHERVPGHTALAHFSCAVCQTVASAQPLLPPGKIEVPAPDHQAITIRLVVGEATPHQRVETASYQSRGPPSAA